MLKENQKIKLRVNRFSLEHYQSKGYEVTVNQTILIRAEDLSTGSDKPVEIICDYCGKEFSKAFKKYFSQRKEVPKDSCFDCFALKQKEVVQQKYGVDSVLELESVKTKSKETLFNNYGVDNPMKDKGIKEKVCDTMEERYGVRYAQQNKEIRNKTVTTLQERYGVDHISKSKVGKENYRKSLKHINGVRVSKGQIELAELLNGELNVFIEGSYADIVLPESKVIVEYDGSGHDLSVKMGKISQEEFDRKDRERTRNLEDSGWSVFRFINSKDKQISSVAIEEFREVIQKKKQHSMKWNKPQRLERRLVHSSEWKWEGS